MRFRAPRQQDDDSLRLELTSMTDIVFLLLIFFMVSTTFVDLSRQLDIQLPDTQAADVVQDVQRHVVELSAQNTLRLDGVDIELSDLTSQLKQRAGKARHRSVEIRADKAKSTVVPRTKVSVVPV
jgi:biopolymer transport protein ExbD